MRFFTLLVLVLSIGCGSHPLSRTKDQQLEEVRRFFADVLEPQPSAEKPPIPFKKACLNHLEALYFAINSPEILEKSGIPEALIHAIPNDFSKLKGESLESILKTLVKQPDSFFSNNQTQIEKAVQDFKFDLEQLSSIEVPKLGSIWTQFFQNILLNYLKDLDLEDKKRVLAFMIRHLKRENTPTQSLLNAVYASGPYFHKYLQLMADYLEPGNDPKLQELKKGLENVKSGLPPIHPYHLELYLQELRTKGVDLEIEKSLGAASVGQAFLVRNKATGTQLVVKFMRPGIQEIADREEKFFLKQAKILPALEESVQQIVDQIKEELDYQKELEKIRLGTRAYKGDSQYPIQVVEPILDFPKSQQYFAMKFVNGQTVEQLSSDFLDKEKTTLKTDAQKKRDQLVKNILWERVLRKFLQQAMFATENAFFHGDLHAGNIMVTGFNPEDELTEEQIKKSIDNNQIQVVLIDFGNAHRLDQDERRRLKNIFLAAAKLSNSPRAFLESMLPNQDLTELQELLKNNVFSYEKRETFPPQKIGNAMDILLANNKAIPSFLMAFKRSLAMLIHIGKDIDSDKLEKIYEQAYTNHLSELLWYDNSPAASHNFWSLLEGIVMRADSSRWEHDAFIKPWATIIFNYQKDFKAPPDGSCWSESDNYYEPLRTCPFRLWRYFF